MQQMKYLELSIDAVIKEPWNEILISDLSDIGFESFLEDESGVLKAYIGISSFDEEKLNMLLKNRKQHVSLSHQTQVLPEENWNAAWEAQFSPVLIGNQLEIIAPFHVSTIKNGYTLVIEPKMTFGTGHHQTTYLICSYLLKYPPTNKQVLDMGTGTGVLAILSEKLGAKSIDAVEIEDWSVENANENAERNNCSRIKVIQGSKEQIPDKYYDLILANINRNILEDQLSAYAKHANSGSTLLLSGFFSTDISQLKEIAEQNDYEFGSNYSKDDWSMLQFIKR